MWYIKLTNRENIDQAIQVYQELMGSDLQWTVMRGGLIFLSILDIGKYNNTLCGCPSIYESHGLLLSEVSLERPPIPDGELTLKDRFGTLFMIDPKEHRIIVKEELSRKVLEMIQDLKEGLKEEYKTLVLKYRH